MDLILKVVNFLKIPTKILIPATCLFSGVMLLASDKILDKLHLLNWSKENGFVFGLLFSITACIIVVYFVAQLPKYARKIWWELTYKHKTMKLIFKKLSDVEKAMICELYLAPDHTCKFDFTQPAVNHLIYVNLIYPGGTQAVTLEWDNSMPMKYMLQPYVWETLDYYKAKFEKKISKLERKVQKETSEKKKKILNDTLKELKEIYNCFDGGINNNG